MGWIDVFGELDVEAHRLGAFGQFRQPERESRQAAAPTYSSGTNGIVAR